MYYKLLEAPIPTRQHFHDTGHIASVKCDSWFAPQAYPFLAPASGSDSGSIIPVSPRKESQYLLCDTKVTVQV